MSINWTMIDDGRIQRSKEVQIKSIDAEAERAEFLGSDESVYTATLNSCTCTDFQRNPYRPCKHMIRLANELNRLDDLIDQQFAIFLSLPSKPISPANEKRPGKKHHSCRALSDYVVIDLETTDNKVTKAGVIEFAAVRVKDNQVVDTFSTLANPGIKNTPAAYAVNRISDEMIETAPPIEQALSDFLDFVGDLPVVGHNISSFDTVLIYDLSVKLRGTPFTNEIVDTYWFSRATHSDIPHQTLSAMCDYYGIVNDQAHRALSDALCTQQLYERLKNYIAFDEVLPASFTLGGYSAERIYESILEITEETSKNVVLKKNKTGASIYMFNAVGFTLRINSRSQYIETSASVAADFVPRIPGASAIKSGGYRFPIAHTKENAPSYLDMILAVYEYRKGAISVETFGCCNDFIRCSDALECLHKDNPEYAGCYYRKNLEAGRIFYGVNKNI